MHSSGLRGEDFRLRRDGTPVSHAALFADVAATDRLGVFAPQGGEGLVVCLLILAHITAFYDRYRAQNEEFFAYPDYFTFQRRSPCVNYGSLDVWPAHKDVTVGSDRGDTLAAITDRAISILAVPLRAPQADRAGVRPADGPGDDVEARATAARVERVRLASAQRTIRRCYLYSPNGQVTDASLRVSCTHPEAAQWISSTAQAAGVEVDTAAEQRYREVTLERALEMLD